MTETSYRSTDDIDPFVRVYGTRVHNLRGVDVAAPRDALVAFTGVSGSGKSSLAFGTIYAEAQRRYFESVAPYARRLLLPPARRRSTTSPGCRPPSPCSSAAARATLAVDGRHRHHAVEPAADALLARRHLPAGRHRATGRRGLLPQHRGRGVPAVPRTRHGSTRSPRQTLVPDPSLSIREGAVAAWPGAWQGQNLRDILDHARLRHRQAVAEAAQEATRLDPVHRRAADRRDRARAGTRSTADYYYNGKFSSAERHVLPHARRLPERTMRERALQFVDSVACPECRGTRLRPEALAVTFAGPHHRRAQRDAAGRPRRPRCARRSSRTDSDAAYESTESGELTEVATMITADLRRAPRRYCSTSASAT